MKVLVKRRKMIETKKGAQNPVPKRRAYYTRNPAINLLLAVLAQAKKDASLTEELNLQETDALSARKMWRDFQETEFYRRKNIDLEAVAWWVCAYLKGLHQQRSESDSHRSTT